MSSLGAQRARTRASQGGGAAHLVDHAREREHRQPAVLELCQLQPRARRLVLAEFEGVEAQVSRSPAVLEHVRHRVLPIHARSTRSELTVRARSDVLPPRFVQSCACLTLPLLLTISSQLMKATICSRPSGGTDETASTGFGL